MIASASSLPSVDRPSRRVLAIESLLDGFPHAGRDVGVPFADEVDRRGDVDFQPVDRDVDANDGVHVEATAAREAARGQVLRLAYVEALGVPADEADDRAFHLEMVSDGDAPREVQS